LNVAGGYCNINNNCHTGNCSSYLFCQGGSFGDACENNNYQGCTDGYCDFNHLISSDTICQPERADGLSCTHLLMCINYCDYANNICISDHCQSSMTDGDETGMDCGGPTCPTCGLQQYCNSNSDCTSGNCALGSCASGATPNGQACTINNQCLSGICGTTTTNLCLALNGEACSSDHQECNSTYCDFFNLFGQGSVCQAKQVNGIACVVGNSCQSGICNIGYCMDASPLDSPCTINNACQSGWCSIVLTGKCVNTSCLTGTIDGLETGVDCGNSNITGCGLCPFQEGCQVNSDCWNNDCSANGHYCTNEIGGQCWSNYDCSSGMCNSAINTCVSDLCYNGVKDGNETDTDCGGVNCTACCT
jgi:hypothetical protein